MLIDSDNIEIQLSRFKISIAILGSLCFIVLGLFFIFYAEIIAPKTVLISRERLIPMIICIGVFGVITFGFFFGIGLKMFFTNPIGLIINDKGIKLPNSDLIKWQNIISINMHIVSRNKIILVYINNAQEIIQRLGLLQRFFAKMTLHFYHTPISISASSLKCNADHLEQLLQQKFAQYRHR